MVALARPGASQLPPKIAIHPRPTAAFVHAMPAHLRSDERGDLVGMKWVAGYATNTALGLPGISALVIVNDPATGIPTAILDGGPITAQRTAAVSGVAIRRFGPAQPAGLDVALIGTGIQGRSHLPVLAHLLPGARLHVFDADAARAEAFAELARSHDGIAEVRVHATAREAVDTTALATSRRTPLLIGVTVLTSLTDDDLREVGHASTVMGEVSVLAQLARACGLDGVVCSAQEASSLRAQYDRSFTLVTPGIRLAGAERNDQARTVTPEVAIGAGADYLVIGRPVTQAADPPATLRAINVSLANVGAPVA